MYKVINSDVYSGLFFLEDNSIDVAITSPPYWRQRDYGFEGQIGNETAYTEYIGKLVTIYNVLRQKLKDKGIFFLNIGDKYLSKYGKSPLGMIPYKLAHFMVEDGWRLDDIIIWYKPNHMPSSVKNRFTNSYEPVFVFSKNNRNIFKEFKESNLDYSNILKINLQPTPYRHVAVFPEKLVSQLLRMVNLPKNGVVLDPFAGSGTTLKVVQDLNNSFNNKHLSAFMIENCQEYINIIKKRCTLARDNIIKNEFIPYNYNNIPDETFYNLRFKKDLKLNKQVKENGFVEICEKKKGFYELLSLFLNGEISRSINEDATCFIGAREFDIELIYNVSLLNKHGWIIRNMIIAEDNKKWFPLFMIVDDNKAVKYRFNYKNLKLKHKNSNDKNWGVVNFIGYKVINNLVQNKLHGIITKILDKYESGFPKYVIVKWEDGSFTKEFVIFSQEKVNNNIKFLYKNNNQIPTIVEKCNLIGLKKSINYYEVKMPARYELFDGNKGYNGKFKNEKRKNWGASPGARASIVEEYFSLQRLYEVDQPLVADLLNFKRVEKKLSKKDLTEKFPVDYKHTVGHWLRKDFGGSVPLSDDWKILTKILNIEDGFTNYVCKTGLKLQTVKTGEYKLPDDFISSDFLNKIEELIK